VSSTLVAFGGAVPIRVELSNDKQSNKDILQGYFFVNGIAGLVAGYKRKQPPKPTNHLVMHRVGGRFTKAVI